MGNDVGWMAITAEDGNSISDMKEKIVSVVKEKRKIHPDDKRAVGYFDLYEQFNRVESLFGALRWVAYFVGVLVLLSGIIGVSNIMLIVIKERTKEIGIRRALGEAPWSIKKQILMESIFLTIISGMFVNPSVSLGVVVSALVILIFSGLLAGFIPAQSAIKIRPIEALRTE